MKLVQITNERFVPETSITEAHQREYRRDGKFLREYSVTLKGGERVSVPEYLWHEMTPCDPYKWINVMAWTQKDRTDGGWIENILAEDVHRTEVIRFDECSGLCDYALHLRSGPDPLILRDVEPSLLSAAFKRAGLIFPEF